LKSGVTLALLAALAFGLAAPVMTRAGRGMGPFFTAALLYAGASGSSLLFGRVFRPSGAPIRRAQAGRIFLIALFGAAVAPALLSWGLQRTGATTGSLLLNLEAVFTVLLAFVFYREHVGARVLGAAACMVLGGGALALGGRSAGSWSTLGAVAIAAATLAWAADNVLTRGVSEQDPGGVVAAKGALGMLFTGVVGVVLGEPVPGVGAAAALVACGATAFGLSLRLYLLAQRQLGAARTGSVFAVAPFIGAAVSWATGTGSPGALDALAALLFGAGVFLHLTERHRHAHHHHATAHEHLHRHDDGHHDHDHDPPFAGEHSHHHEHQPVQHEHEHGADPHHDHTHD
jgi:drug/metabolite transporter (DMT)-like permease